MTRYLNCSVLFAVLLDTLDFIAQVLVMELRAMVSFADDTTRFDNIAFSVVELEMRDLPNAHCTFLIS